MRRVFCIVALAGVTAFAPAPLPRRARGGSDGEISLATFQGTWRVASMQSSRRDGRHLPHKWNITHFRVSGAELTYLENGSTNARYTVVIGNQGRPATIDFYNGEAKGIAPGQGIIRRKGDVVEILYVFGVFGGTQRAVSFEQPPDNQWLLTLHRER
jgi:uncharacterized protein (TIGR03067 family)